MFGRRITVIFCGVVAATALPFSLQGGNCKPNFSGKDRITKAVTSEWAQSLYHTGLLAAALVTTSQINVTASVARIGDANTVNIILEKQESNPGRAVVESPYKAEKGNEFLFGFKEGGDPLRFIADVVTNNTSADMFGNVNTRVVLTAHVKADDLAAIKNSLSTKHIDSVRVSLSNNVVIEQSVSDKDGLQFGEKINCWLGSGQENTPAK